MFWLKVKAFFGAVGDFLIPFIKIFATESGKIILDLALQAVTQMAKTGIPSGEKREEAFKSIMVDLQSREIKAATSTIYYAIEAAYAKLKDK